MTPPPAALFDVDPDAPDVLVPTELARGPWDPGALHGGPVGAAVVRAAERLTTATGAGGLRVARCTVELERPVPLETLRFAAHVSRPGRKVQWVDVDVQRASDGARVARGRVLFLRRLDLFVGNDPLVLPEPVDVARPDTLPTTVSSWSTDLPAFHRHGAEHRFAVGRWDDPGPVAVWIRLRVPVVAGEVPSGPQRAVAAADFANGVSWAIESERFRFLNPDLSVTLFDDPQGEWVLLDARTRYGASGGAFSDSRLADERGGVLGRSTQSLLVEPVGA